MLYNKDFINVQFANNFNQNYVSKINKDSQNPITLDSITICIQINDGRITVHRLRDGKGILFFRLHLVLNVPKSVVTTAD